MIRHSSYPRNIHKIKTIQEGIAKEAAEDAKTLLENAGAGIALK